MKLQKVSIKNFKGIGYKELEFKAGINIIKGENGTGKTSVMEALATLLSQNLKGIDRITSGKAGRKLVLSDARCIYRNISDAGYTPTYAMPLNIQGKVLMEEKLYDIGVHFEMDGAEIWEDSIRPSKEFFEIFNSIERVLPILTYEGIPRNNIDNSLEIQEGYDASLFCRNEGYNNSLKPVIDIKFIHNWCARMEQISWQQEKRIAEYEAVKAAVAQFMDRINEEKDKTGKIIYEKRTEQLLYVSEKEAIQISSLSAGYQSLVWIAFDIACRMAILNPFLKEDICQTPGIVLIDEIDLHLHPKWQWNVLNALHEVFPNVQFIVTTHSPIIIASIKGSWVLDIEKEEAEYGYTHYGLDINDTLKICQESQSLPSEIQERIDDFYLWIDEGELNRAKEVLEKLKKEIGTSVPVVVEARVCYDMECMNCE